MKGCLSPVETLINILRYEKVIDQQMRGEAIIIWDFDSKGLMIKNKNEDVWVTIEGFKSFIKQVVSGLKVDLKELLFDFNIQKLNVENMYDIISELKKDIEI